MSTNNHSQELPKEEYHISEAVKEYWAKSFVQPINNRAKSELGIRKIVSNAAFRAGVDWQKSRIALSHQQKAIGEYKAEVLWDRHSEHIDDDLDSLQVVAGTSVMTRSSFMKAVTSLPAPSHSDAGADLVERMAGMRDVMDKMADALRLVNQMCPEYTGEYTFDSSIGDFMGDADHYASEMQSIYNSGVGDIARSALTLYNSLKNTHPNGK